MSKNDTYYVIAYFEKQVMTRRGWGRKRKLLHLKAHHISVNDQGDLLLWQDAERIYRTFAQGEWLEARFDHHNG